MTVALYARVAEHPKVYLDDSLEVFESSSGSGSPLPGANNIGETGTLANEERFRLF